MHNILVLNTSFFNKADEYAPDGTYFTRLVSQVAYFKVSKVLSASIMCFSGVNCDEKI